MDDLRRKERDELAIALQGLDADLVVAHLETEGLGEEVREREEEGRKVKRGKVGREGGRRKGGRNGRRDEEREGGERRDGKGKRG